MADIIKFQNPEENKLNEYRKEVDKALENFEAVDKITYDKIQNGEKPTEEEINSLMSAMAELARSSGKRDEELHRLGKKAPSDDIDMAAVKKEVIRERTGMAIIK